MVLREYAKLQLRFDEVYCLRSARMSKNHSEMLTAVIAKA